MSLIIRSLSSIAKLSPFSTNFLASKLPLLSSSAFVETKEPRRSYLKDFFRENVSYIGKYRMGYKHSDMKENFGFRATTRRVNFIIILVLHVCYNHLILWDHKFFCMHLSYEFEIIFNNMYLDQVEVRHRRGLSDIIRIRKFGHRHKMSFPEGRVQIMNKILKGNKYLTET